MSLLDNVLVDIDATDKDKRESSKPDQIFLSNGNSNTAETIIDNAHTNNGPFTTPFGTPFESNDNDRDNILLIDFDSNINKAVDSRAQQHGSKHVSELDLEDDRMDAHSGLNIHIGERNEGFVDDGNNNLVDEHPYEEIKDVLASMAALPRREELRSIDANGKETKANDIINTPQNSWFTTAEGNHSGDLDSQSFLALNQNDVSVPNCNLDFNISSPPPPTDLYAVDAGVLSNTHYDVPKSTPEKVESIDGSVSPTNISGAESLDSETIARQMKSQGLRRISSIGMLSPSKSKVNHQSLKETQSDPIVDQPYTKEDFDAAKADFKKKKRKGFGLKGKKSPKPKRIPSAIGSIRNLIRINKPSTSDQQPDHIYTNSVVSVASPIQASKQGFLVDSLQHSKRPDEEQNTNKIPGEDDNSKDGEASVITDPFDSSNKLIDLKDDYSCSRPGQSHLQQSDLFLSESDDASVSSDSFAKNFDEEVDATSTPTLESTNTFQFQEQPMCEVDSSITLPFEDPDIIADLQNDHRLLMDRNNEPPCLPQKSIKLVAGGEGSVYGVSIQPTPLYDHPRWPPMASVASSDDMFDYSRANDIKGDSMPEELIEYRRAVPSGIMMQRLPYSQYSYGRRNMKEGNSSCNGFCLLLANMFITSPQRSLESLTDSITDLLQQAEMIWKQTGTGSTTVDEAHPILRKCLGPEFFRIKLGHECFWSIDQGLGGDSPYDALKEIFFNCVDSRHREALVITFYPDKSSVVLFDQNGDQRFVDIHVHFRNNREKRDEILDDPNCGAVVAHSGKYDWSTMLHFIVDNMATEMKATASIGVATPLYGVGEMDALLGGKEVSL